MERWERNCPEFTNGTMPGRHPDTYRRVLEQFDVVNNPRYKGDNGLTFCNIYTSDVLDAMCVPPGHWWLGEELSANAMSNWLLKNGPRYGWRRVDVDHARNAANSGRPTLAIWSNPHGSGHVAMVIPGPDKGPLRIAQAGRNNLWDKPITEGFGDVTELVVLWSHP